MSKTRAEVQKVATTLNLRAQKSASKEYSVFKKYVKKMGQMISEANTLGKRLRAFNWLMRRELVVMDVWGDMDQSKSLLTGEDRHNDLRAKFYTTYQKLQGKKPSKKLYETLSKAEEKSAAN